MANIQTRSSILAVKVESTEGTPVVPAAGTDAVALQADFTMEPAFDTLTNDELKASIGQAKPIQGLENPTVGFSHYLRSSGVEGQEVNFGALVYSALGAKSVASTEYDTFNGSSTSTIVMPSSEGANFERGEALLIKDSTNGYRIRAVHSVSGDNLSLSFVLPNAPASGVNLGKCVLYKPANSSHPTLSVWHYLGNSGAVQMMAGGRVTSMDIDITAGELINASYGIDGLAYYFDPIEITSSTRYLDWTNDDGTFAAAVTAKWYKDPHELAEALQTAMNTASTGETATVSYSNSTGKFTITSTGSVLSLLFNSGTNTANTIATKIGFSAASDQTGTAAGTGYTSANAITLTFPYTASYDNADPLAAKNHEIMIGSQSDYVCFGASAVSVSIANEKADQLSVCAESGRSGSIIATRTVTMSVTSLLSQYDAEKMKSFRKNDEIRLQYSFGAKSGGNWVAGKCGCIYIPTAVITSISITDEDGLATLNLELQAFVDSSGNGEAYIGTL